MLIKKALWRVVIVGGIVVTALAVTSGPAAAANATLTFTGPFDDTLRGAMTHIDDGDKFRVCDANSDGHAVVGRLYEQQVGGSELKLTIDDGGDAGCDYKTYNIAEGKPYVMEVSWNGWVKSKTIFE